MYYQKLQLKTAKSRTQKVLSPSPSYFNILIGSCKLPTETMTSLCIVWVKISHDKVCKASLMRWQSHVWPAFSKSSLTQQVTNHYHCCHHHRAHYSSLTSHSAVSVTMITHYNSLTSHCSCYSLPKSHNAVIIIMHTTVYWHLAAVTTVHQ